MHHINPCSSRELHRSGHNVRRFGLAIAFFGMVSIQSVNAQVPAVPGVDPALAALLTRCAPQVHPETMAAIVSAESRGHQFAIADAGPVHLPWAQRKHLVRSLYPSSLEEAMRTAQSLIANGHTVSLGVAQVNDRNLRRLGLSLRDLFEPCQNIAAGAAILTEFYIRAESKFGKGTPKALRAALSAYNSGDWLRGERDGYVDLVYKQVGKPLAIRTTPTQSRTVTTSRARPQLPKGISTEARKAFPLQVTEFSPSP